MSDVDEWAIGHPCRHSVSQQRFVHRLGLTDLTIMNAVAHVIRTFLEI